VDHVERADDADVVLEIGEVARASSSIDVGDERWAAVDAGVE
jgi:hypothetical protein